MGVTIYSAAGNHGYYGNVLEICTALSREDAVRGLLKKIIDCIDEDDQMRLLSETEQIVSYMANHDAWMGGDSDTEFVDTEYLHIVINERPLLLSVLGVVVDGVAQ